MHIRTLACEEVSFKLFIVLLKYHVLITIILGCEVGTHVNEMDGVMCEKNNNFNLRKKKEITIICNICAGWIPRMFWLALIKTVFEAYNTMSGYGMI